MISELQTQAELNAVQSEKLPAFGGLNLLHIKRNVEQLIGLIGRDGIFDQYTKHDISHIDEMLRNLDWIIPDQTKEVMSPADWLLAVLSIYFHDLGMLVTREEFNARANSAFPVYRDKVLFGGDIGTDYRAKVYQLEEQDRERFLYQEYVREHHAERIRRWIAGHPSQHLGVSNKTIQAVEELLRPLSEQFRRDLALVCESHHLDDLNDLSKYKVSQPYGNSDQETANLQYAAVLLRTSDLLHVTSDRTPSIAFRVINPTDPLSQQEWAKQMAVKRVRPQLGVNKDGNPDPTAPKDTIEVHAYFKSEDGFFGLTSYLTYVASQLQKNYDWVETASRTKGDLHKFPWKRIDDSGVETVGFLRHTYEFTIDQAKILDLLTGHTLYNDSSVVLRELVQNSIDAVRLQSLQDARAGKTTAGRIAIHWDTEHKELSVQDNRLLIDEILKLPTLVVERDGARSLISPEDLQNEPSFWTTDCALLRSAEMLFREVPGAISIATLQAALKSAELHLPQGPVICGPFPSPSIEARFFSRKEVEEIVVHPHERRADFKWVSLTEPARWIDIRRLLRRIAPEESAQSAQAFSSLETETVLVGRGPIAISGLTDELGVRSQDRLFLLPNAPISKFMIKACEDAEKFLSDDSRRLFPIYVLEVVTFLLRTRTQAKSIPKLKDWLDKFGEHVRGLSRVRWQAGAKIFDDSDLLSLGDALRESNWEIFSPSAWFRKADK